ncbi:M20 family metallopeptidase [Desulfovibrio ferrophilus]|uniref:Carboxypeptidase G2 n=1 Tax=Desulfovibrio ferrophilus TaxID=241368 RepID=A0A2Z6B173_9BACT|nr:M20 family metallopeptidase [Desulfovibrio ferrophilus]BBD09198.1 carboxypeptidase G2 [Desulfovibrio ferrophilus]
MIKALRNFLVEHESEMFELLESLVRINSYSGNKAGVDKVVDVLDATMKDMGFSTCRHAQPETGDNLVAWNQARSDNPGALLIGHMDTVFPPEMGFDRFDREGNEIHGPGTYDMKGGIVAGIFALKALDAAGLLEGRPVACLFNSDEEIGSPNSRELVMEEARKSAFCFVMEGSGLNGEIVTGRKGRIVFNLEVQGKAAHAGHCGFPKPSAILEMAHQIVAMEALNDPEAGTSLNVGLTEGGVGPNTVSASAKARVETRFVNKENGDKVWAAIETIAAAPKTEGTSCKLEIITSRPPMVTNDSILALHDLVAEAGADLGLPVKGTFRGGGSDANIVAQVGIPVLDGMGPAGGKLHTQDEYLAADSMVKRTLLAAVSIHRALDKYQ